MHSPLDILAEPNNLCSIRESVATYMHGCLPTYSSFFEILTLCDKKDKYKLINLRFTVIINASFCLSTNLNLQKNN